MIVQYRQVNGYFRMGDVAVDMRGNELGVYLGNAKVWFYQPVDKNAIIFFKKVSRLKRLWNYVAYQLFRLRK